MTSTPVLPCRSHRNEAKDAQAAQGHMQSPLSSWRRSPSKQDKKGGKAALTPAVPSITFAAVDADNAAAVAATYPHRNPFAPSAPAVHAAVPVHCTCSTLTACQTVPADIMPTVVLAATANFITAEAMAADVSIATVAAYSMLGVTITDGAELGDITAKAVELGNLCK